MFRTFLSGYEAEFIVGLGAFAFLASLVFIFLYLRLARRLRRIETLLRGASSPNLEQILEEYHRFLASVDRRLDTVVARLDAADRTLEQCVRTPSVMRFNAFPDMGSDLSFAIALLDGRADGVVMSSLYGRSESRTYAKPVEKGRSAYHLTDEEKAVLERALQGRTGDAS
ncbi:MAG: DUF4446 family protein [Desulfotomaculales bacterium]